ncbi:hypothetical protein MADA3029_830076 [Vibrio nigripulchritudo MADA3029]|nr:hypothetical protein VIBNIMADA3020_1100067 [Vibrio nigripulchritudo MADA3020]CCN52981.1 hypothetical protein VIBNIMADA3021_170119 [Vibrio nigripulchritudo MADA3021]CCN61583.1 hypothetical protein MADA3029_830076 [Vibrio nigripulchritudo MADA3029]
MQSGTHPKPKAGRPKPLHMSRFWVVVILANRFYVLESK